MTARRHVATLVSIALCAALVACGGGGVETSEAPGFSDEVAAVDRSPFELAGPNGDRSGTPTTITGSDPTLPLPPDVAERVRPGDPNNRTTTTTQSTTTTTPPTTTTIPDTRPVIRQSGTITDLCGLHRAIYSTATILDDATIDVVSTHNEVRASLDRYYQVAPADWRDRVKLVRDVIFLVTDRLSQAGFQLTDPGVSSLIADVASGRNGYGPFLAAVEDIYQLEQFLCR